MLAFHSRKSIKDDYLSRVLLHQAAGEIVQGQGFWNYGRGNALGCTVHGDDPLTYEQELGIPSSLALLKGFLFELLPVSLAVKFPESFLSVIRPGADLSMVWPQFAVWLLENPAEGVLQFADSYETRYAIRRVGQLFRDGCTESLEWRKAALAAELLATKEGPEEVLAALSTAFCVAWAMFRSLVSERILTNSWDLLVETSPSSWAANAVVSHWETSLWILTCKKPSLANVEAEVQPASWFNETPSRESVKWFMRKTAFIKQANKLLELLRAA